MGKKIKICTIFLAILLASIIFNVCTVSAYDMTIYAWKNYDQDKDLPMYIRLYMGPAKEEILEYKNRLADSDGKIYYNSKLIGTIGERVVNKDGTELKYKAFNIYNADGTFKASYKGGNSYWIYNEQKGMESYPDTGQYKVIGMFFHDSVMCDYDSKSGFSMQYRGDITTSQYLNLSVDEEEGMQKAATVSKKATEPKVYATVLNTTGTFVDSEWGTGKFIQNPRANAAVQYRYAIVEMGAYNNYVDDSIIPSDVVKTLQDELKNANSSECYVSQITISRPYDWLWKRLGYNVYEMSWDTYTFIKKQQDKSDLYKGNSDLWTGLKGNYDGGWGSVANIFDNKVIFPQFSERTVRVRKYVLTEGENISGAKYILQDGTDEYITVDGEIIYSANTNEWHSEIYEQLDSTSEIIKSIPAEADTRFLGYNISVAGTYDEAIANLSRYISNNTYTPASVGQNISVSGTTTNSDDQVVIDMFYTKYDGPVKVNHIFVDENNNVVSSSNPTLASENYVKKINVPITVQRDETTAQTYDYIGYDEQVGQHEKSSITGKRTLTGTTTSVTINSNVSSTGKTINFYYRIKYPRIVYVRVYNKASSGTYMLLETDTIAGITRKLKVNGVERIGDSNATWYTERYVGLYNEDSIAKEVPTEITLKHGTKLEFEGYKIADKSDISDAKYAFDLMATAPYNTEVPEGGITYGPVKCTLNNVIVIDLYYTPKLEKIAEPTRNITGRVFIEKLTQEMPQGSCNDTGTGLSITSVPSGSKAKVGIESVTKNILASINTKRIYKTNKINLTVNGSVNYKFEYNVGYDIVTDMALYRLKGTWVYDDNLFGWSSDMHHDSHNTTPSVNTVDNNVKVYIIDGTVENEIKTTGNVTLNGLKNPNNLKIKIVVANTQITIDGQTITNAGKKEGTYSLTNNELYRAETDRININQSLYKNGFGLLTKENYTNAYLISTLKENGVRILNGEAYYTYIQVIGSTNKDNMYEKGKTFDANTEGITQNYEVNNSAINVQEKYSKVAPINIYTPITVSAEFATSKVEDLFNQSEIVVNNSVQENTQVIQANTPFTIKFGNKGTPSGYGLITDTIRYSMKYYIKFDFDVHDVYINGKLFKKGERVSSGEWIEVAKNSKTDTTVTAQAYGSGLGAVTSRNNTYTVRALAYNATRTMEERLITIDSLENLNTNTGLNELLKNICSVPSYVAEEKYSVAIVNRIYDFRITDLTDLDWKNIFRRSSEGITNTHTGTIYYPGTTKIQETSNRKINVVNRTSNEIGRNPLRTLPLGPYKHTDTTYIQAPKLGYRFSFDMKITGAQSEDKYVSIKTRFYYISKDGKTFLEEYNGSGEGIYLFYKTSNGKYVRIDETGGGYELKFTPNDGYRYITGTDKSTLATTQVSLGNLRSIILNFKMMTKTDSDTIYYGEYKLPNSTIAVKVDKNGKYDINSPLKEGYIGVIFEIKAYVGKVTVDGYERDMILSYNKNIQTGTINTSQWDYEGYLGYTSLGKEVPNNGLNMKLEKGTWKITDEVYNKIKGSVILYDIDAKAATDYE